MNKKIIKRAAGAVLCLALIGSCSKIYVSDASTRTPIGVKKAQMKYGVHRLDLEASVEEGTFKNSVTVEFKAHSRDVYYKFSNESYDVSKKIPANSSVTFTFDETTNFNYQPLSNMLDNATDDEKNYYLNNRTDYYLGTYGLTYTIVKVGEPQFTVDKEAGLYFDNVKVKVKALDGYNVYYTTNDKFSSSKVIKSGKSKSFTFEESTNLKLQNVDKNKKVSSEELNNNSKAAWDYNYVIEKEELTEEQKKIRKLMSKAEKDGGVTINKASIPGYGSIRSDKGYTVYYSTDETFNTYEVVDTPRGKEIAFRNGLRLNFVNVASDERYPVLDNENVIYYFVVANNNLDIE